MRLNQLGQTCKTPILHEVPDSFLSKGHPKSLVFSTVLYCSLKTVPTCCNHVKNFKDVLLTCWQLWLHAYRPSSTEINIRKTPCEQRLQKFGRKHAVLTSTGLKRPKLGPEVWGAESAGHNACGGADGAGAVQERCSLHPLHRHEHDIRCREVQGVHCTGAGTPQALGMT